MDGLIWVWLSEDWRRWAFQVRTIPAGARLVAPNQASRNRVLALAHRMGHAGLRVLLQSEVDEVVGLWRLKLAVKGQTCLDGSSAVRSAVAVSGREDRPRSADFPVRRRVPFWARAASAQRKRARELVRV